MLRAFELPLGLQGESLILVALEESGDNVILGSFKEPRVQGPVEDGDQLRMVLQQLGDG